MDREIRSAVDFIHLLFGEKGHDTFNRELEILGIEKDEATMKELSEAVWEKEGHVRWTKLTENLMAGLNLDIKTLLFHISSISEVDKTLAILTVAALFPKSDIARALLSGQFSTYMQAEISDVYSAEL